MNIFPREFLELGITYAACINLRRRSERWDVFHKRAQLSGFGFIPRFEAIDGRNLPIPEGLRSHQGAYGCLHSHGAVYQSALEAGHSRILVTEDDCVFTAGVAEISHYLTATVGQFSWIHLGNPENLGVIERRPSHIHVAGVLNTHAYVIDRSLMQHYVERNALRPFPTNQLLHADRALIWLCYRHSLRICVPPRPLASQDKAMPRDVQWGVPAPVR